jgi:hypothetical protein
LAVLTSLYDIVIIKGMQGEIWITISNSVGRMEQARRMLIIGAKEQVRL